MGFMKYQIKVGIQMHNCIQANCQFEMDTVQLLQKYISTLEQEREVKNHEVQALYVSLEGLERDNAHLRDQNKQIKSLNDQLRNENHCILNELYETRRNAQELEFHFRKTEQEMSFLRENHDMLMEERNKLLRNYEGVQDQLKALELRVDEESKIEDGDQSFSYTQLQQALKDETVANQNLQDLLQQQNERIQELQLYHQNDGNTIQNLEAHVEELLKSENKLKEELKNLKEEYRCLEEQYEENCQQSPANVRELIQNYEKIEAIANDQYQENEKLKASLEALKEYSADLQIQLQQYEQQVQASRSNSKNRQSSISHPSVSEVVRQNNLLIEKITELEKEKNFLYAERGKSSQNKTSRSNVSPLKSANRSAHSHASVSRLKSRIEILRQQNENILEALRLD